MEDCKIHLPQGELKLKQLDETISKMKFSLIALAAILVVMHGLSIFENFQFEANIFSVFYAGLLLLRGFHLRKLNSAENSFELTKAWKQVYALSLFNAFLNACMFTAIIAYPASSTTPYLGVIAIIGTLVGGSSVFYQDFKYYNLYALMNLAIPTIYLVVTGGKEHYLLATVLGIFHFYVRQTTQLQNRYYWDAQEDQRFLNLMIDSLPSPVSILDKNLNFIKVNQSLSKYYKNSPEDYIGKPLGFFGGYDESKELIYFLNEFVKNTRSNYQEKEISLSIGNRQRHFYFVVARIENTSNIACLSLDLSDLKAAQKELEQQKAMGIEAAKLSSIGEMANSMAHEINNPLSVILGKSEQASRVLENENPNFAYLRKSLGIISENVKRIATIIQGLRTLSGESNEGTFDLQLEDVFEQVRLLSSERVLSTGAQLTLEAPPKEYIQGNPSQLAQVILHLINNSLEAINHQDNPWIKISFLDTAEHIEINIQDSGNGIPIELSEKVFHPFFSTKELGKGMGLGLSVSKGIIEAHRGEFFIDNACKHTSFVIRLPKLFSAAA